jgi:hypothetical protein
VLQVLLLLLVAPLPVQHHLRTIISIVNHNSREPITHDTSSQSHLGTLLLEGGVVAGVGGERLVAEVDDVRADLVQEGDVVRHAPIAIHRDKNRIHNACEYRVISVDRDRGLINIVQEGDVVRHAPIAIHHD